ncbi:microtubule-associated protein tau isoform X2 [Aethina tumida]|uniref:microtubule-associated protein tau isoform X2 n=1 Tax=Aethina tumida TaxID=116153 RepID=UPI0021486955|nr:microtubule-associated protein tau isoform X2 [Aethina tumida]
MQETANTVLNGPSHEFNRAPSLKDDNQDVPQHHPQQQQQQPQHQNGAPVPSSQPIRPPLTRIDSRSNFPPNIRPGFPNGPPVVQNRPQIRPGQPPFIQRGLAPGVRPQGPVPFPQNQFQQGYPPNQPRANFRPVTPYPRPPQRPQGIFPQRSVPSFGQRPQLSEEEQPNPELQRSQTLDPNESPKHNEETARPNLAAMKNRSYSLQSNSSDHQDNGERRRSIASVDGNEEKEDAPEKPENLSRPESRMKKIAEDEDDEKLSITSTSNRSPSSLTDVSQNSHNETFSKTSNNHEVTLSESNGVTSKPQTSKQDSRPASRAEAPKDTPLVATPTKSEGDNDSGVDESTQGNEVSSNGESRTTGRKSAPKSRTSSATPTKGRSLSRGSKSPASLLSPDSTATTPGSEKKKVPMNKIQVGSAPSPNLKVVRSKIGSLENASHKPGGGKVKIESKKIDFKNATPRIEAKNDKYTPKGGEKKIQSTKLQWNAKSRIGSLENASHKPKGGDKKIETVKLDFKEKAKPKVGSTANLKHVPGGGDIKIETKKIELTEVTSKVGSLDNMKHKPGGGDKKIFDDKEYLKQKASTGVSNNQSLSGSQGPEYLYTFY